MKELIEYGEISMRANLMAMEADVDINNYDALLVDIRRLVRSLPLRLISAHTLVQLGGMGVEFKTPSELYAFYQLAEWKIKASRPGLNLDSSLQLIKTFMAHTCQEALDYDIAPLEQATHTLSEIGSLEDFCSSNEYILDMDAFVQYVQDLYDSPETELDYDNVVGICEDLEKLAEGLRINDMVKVLMFHINLTLGEDKVLQQVAYFHGKFRNLSSVSSFVVILVDCLFELVYELSIAEVRKLAEQ